MHFMSQLRYNPKTQKDEYYYRIKESFRDLTGRARNHIMLNVGFIDEEHRPEDIRDIGKCITYINEHKNEDIQDLFGDPLSGYSEFAQRKARQFWDEMVNNGSIDVVKEKIEQSREKAERLVDVDTVKHTDARDIGAERICLQALRELKIGELLSYWIVNTIRYKLKQRGITCYWTEIVRIMSTQKAITTGATNALGEKVHLRLCNEPNKSADEIYSKLGYKKMPFRKIKIDKVCSTQ